METNKKDSMANNKKERLYCLMNALHPRKSSTSDSQWWKWQMCLLQHLMKKVTFVLKKEWSKQCTKFNLSNHQVQMDSILLLLKSWKCIQYCLCSRHAYGLVMCQKHEKELRGFSCLKKNRVLHASEIFTNDNIDFLPTTIAGNNNFILHQWR